MSRHIFPVLPDTAWALFEISDTISLFAVCIIDAFTERIKRMNSCGWKTAGYSRHNGPRRELPCGQAWPQTKRCSPLGRRWEDNTSYRRIEEPGQDSLRWTRGEGGAKKCELLKIQIYWVRSRSRSKSGSRSRSRTIHYTLLHKSGINSRFKLRYKFHSKPGFRSGFRTKFKGRNTSWIVQSCRAEIIYFRLRLRLQLQLQPYIGTLNCSKM